MVNKTMRQRLELARTDKLQAAAISKELFIRACVMGRDPRGATFCRGLELGANDTFEEWWLKGYIGDLAERVSSDHGAFLGRENFGDTTDSYWEGTREYVSRLEDGQAPACFVPREVFIGPGVREIDGGADWQVEIGGYNEDQITTEKTAYQAGDTFAITFRFASDVEVFQELRAQMARAENAMHRVASSGDSQPHTAGEVAFQAKDAAGNRLHTMERVLDRGRVLDLSIGGARPANPNVAKRVQRAVKVRQEAHAKAQAGARKRNARTTSAARI